MQFRGYIDFSFREQDPSGTGLEIGFTWHRGKVTAVAQAQDNAPKAGPTGR